MKKLLFFLPLLFLCMACHKEPMPEPEPELQPKPQPAPEVLPCSMDITGITWKLDRIIETYEMGYYSEKKDIYYTDTVAVSPQWEQQAYTLYMDSAKELKYRGNSYGYFERYTFYTSCSRIKDWYWLIDERHFNFELWPGSEYPRASSHPLDKFFLSTFTTIDSFTLNKTLDTLTMKGHKWINLDMHVYTFVFHKK